MVPPPPTKTGMRDTWEKLYTMIESITVTVARANCLKTYSYYMHAHK